MSEHEIDSKLQELLNEIHVSVPTLGKMVFLTTGNYGYKDMIVNWWLSLRSSTSLEKHAVIFTYDTKLLKYLSNYPQIHTFYLPYKYKNTKNNLSDPTAFKKGEWDAITRYKLYAIWKIIQCGFHVLFADPDIYWIKNPIPFLKKNHVYPKNPDVKVIQPRMWIQQGKPYCSGVMYVEPNMLTNDLFNPDKWSICKTDDENYIKNYVKNSVSAMQTMYVFPLKEFPNGLIWHQPDKMIHDRISSKQYYLLHFNYISGVENKINRMKTYDMWFGKMKIAPVPSDFCPNLNKVCLNQRGVAYPPHQKDDQIEAYTFNYIKTKMQNKAFVSEYTYLPIYWTSIAISNNPVLNKKVQMYCSKLFRTNPNTKYWTVIQHCKGLKETFGFALPPGSLVFETSIPEAARSITKFLTMPTSDFINHKNPYKPFKTKRRTTPRMQITKVLVSDEPRLEGPLRGVPAPRNDAPGSVRDGVLKEKVKPPPENKEIEPTPKKEEEPPKEEPKEIEPTPKKEEESKEIEPTPKKEEESKEIEPTPKKEEESKEIKPTPKKEEEPSQKVDTPTKEEESKEIEPVPKKEEPKAQPKQAKKIEPKYKIIAGRKIPYNPKRRNNRGRAKRRQQLQQLRNARGKKKVPKKAPPKVHRPSGQPNLPSGEARSVPERQRGSSKTSRVLASRDRDAPGSVRHKKAPPKVVPALSPSSYPKKKSMSIGSTGISSQAMMRSGRVMYFPHRRPVPVKPRVLTGEEVSKLKEEAGRKKKAAIAKKYQKKSIVTQSESFVLNKNMDVQDWKVQSIGMRSEFLKTIDCDKTILIPLLSSSHLKSKKRSSSKSHISRTKLASFIGNLNVHPIRLQMKTHLGNKKGVIIDQGSYKDKRQANRFEHLMWNSIFALCPRGFGNTSFRLFEAMEMGAIPIYISDVFSLPFADKINWDEICIMVTPNEIPNLYKRLDCISDVQRFTYQKRIKEIYKQYFTMKNTCERMMSYIT